MKYTFSGKELSEPAADRSVSAEARRDMDLGTRGGCDFLKGSYVRILAVLCVSAVVLYFCLGNMLSQAVLGACVILFQAALIELVGGMFFRRKSALKSTDCTARALRERKWTSIIWAVEWVLVALGLILWQTYWCMLFKA